MKKDLLSDNLFNKCHGKHFIKTASLSLVLLCGAPFVYAEDTGLSGNVTVKGNKAKLETVLNSIEQQTNYLFVYNDGVDTNRRVSIDVQKESITNVLDKLFDGTNVKYVIDGEYIVLSGNANSLKTSSVNQQKKKITGTVVDQSGEPVIGANIIEKGTTNGVISDLNGNFSLNVSPNAILEVTYVGYKPKAVSVNGKSVLNIVIEEDTEALDEVVVVGYGTARKGDLTGPVSSVAGKSLAERSTQQLSTALQGQVSGVQVTRSSGEPGASATIRVRGVTTLSTNDPLVIIDGVPGSINDVIASDVETMTVLKDAASAAIYGSRAAAGVILITTKRAKENKFQLDYNYEYSIDKATTRPTNGDVVDWMNIQNEIKYNDGAKELYSQYSKETIDSWMSNNATDPYHYPNTDWVSLLLKNTTNHQQHNLNVSGGSDALKSKFSFTYQSGDGYYNNKSYERYAGRVNNDYKISSWIHANVDIDFSTSKNISPASINPIYQAYLTSPYYNAYWADGSYAESKSGANPVAMLNEGGTSNTYYYKFGGKAQLDLNPVKGLTLTAIFAPRYTFTNGKKFTKKVNVYDEAGNATTAQYNKSTSLDETRNNTQSRTYQFYANYQNKWNDHSLSAMVGYEGYKYKWENLGASRTNYDLENFPYLNVGPEDYQYNSGSAGHNAYESVFGRVMYSFKDRYLLQANVRADGSSRFASDSRWGVFPSVSAGWVASSEPWFPKNDVIDYLKVRGSIGKLGNERIGSEFPYQASISFGNSYMYDKSTSSVTAVQNAAQVYYAFKDITWETTTTYDIGLDFNLFNSRLTFTGDYYYKKTENMLLTLGFPSYAGFSAPSQNAGDMHTKGWEFDIAWRDRIGDWSYGASFNLSDYRSKMGYLGDKRTIDGNYIYEEGSYYYEWYMYKTDGLFITDADLYDENVNKYPTLTANDKAGNIKYVDVNGDGVINADDKVRLGNSLPEFIYGGSLNLGWKDIDFSLQFQGVGHQNVLFNSAWIQPIKEQWGAVPSLLLGNYWSQSNTDEQNMNAKYPRLTYTNTANTYTGSDYWLFNGAYFRVKNITLGYTLPDNIMKKIFVKGLRVYFTANDLPALSHYPKGWDPEVGSTSDFISTSFTFGANIKF
jgi:TonB-linked SusC/RagA family outer membrane protein